MTKNPKPIPDTVIYKDHEGNGLFSDETYITSELGGEDHRLRCYVVISTLNNKPFATKQIEIVKKQFNQVAKKHDSKIEDIEFSKNYALIKILVSIEVALQDLIDDGMNACNLVEEFLRFHFFATNVQKPIKKIIDNYLNEITEKKIN